jgi:hypothetical protein
LKQAIKLEFKLGLYDKVEVLRFTPTVTLMIFARPSNTIRSFSPM